MTCADAVRYVRKQRGRNVEVFMDLWEPVQTTCNVMGEFVQEVGTYGLQITLKCAISPINLVN